MADTNTTGEAMNKTVDASIAGIERLSQAVEKIAPDAWSIAVRQQVIEGWSEISFTVMLFIFLCITSFISYKLIKLVNWDEYSNPDTKRDVLYLVAGIIFGVVSFICCISFGAHLSHLTTDIGHILNPEYWAAVDIVEMVK